MMSAAGGRSRGDAEADAGGCTDPAVGLTDEMFAVLLAIDGDSLH